MRRVSAGCRAAWADSQRIDDESGAVSDHRDRREPRSAQGEGAPTRGRNREGERCDEAAPLVR